MTTASAPVMPDQLAVLLGIETTYGAQPSSAIGALVTGFRPTGLNASVAVPEIGGATVSSREPFAQAPDLREPALGVSALLDVENLETWLRPFFGAPIIASGSGLDTGFQQLLFVNSGAVQSLTVRGVINGEARTLLGLVGDTLEIPLGKSGGQRSFTASYLASEHQRNVAWTPGTTSGPRPRYLVPGWSARLLVNGVALPITDGTLTISGGASRSPDINNRDTSGARPGRVSVTASLSLEFKTPEQMAILTRAATGNLDAVQVEMWPDAQNRRRLLVEVPFCRLQAPDFAVEAAAAGVPVSATLTAERDPAGVSSTVAFIIWRAAS